MKHLMLGMICLFWVIPAGAADSNVRVWKVEQDLDTVYPVLRQALEANRFYVVFEPDIQRNLSAFAERWGKDYNRNQLQGIRAMVFCNGWYANRVSNADPDLMALCPLHLTLIQQNGATRILFVRPTVVAAGSKAGPVAEELEEAVSEAVAQALEELGEGSRDR
ncbi:MAG: DUF302 domain-containing protein [Gammaproteobacteria bacterium]